MGYYSEEIKREALRLYYTVDEFRESLGRYIFFYNTERISNR